MKRINVFIVFVVLSIGLGSCAGNQSVEEVATEVVEVVEVEPKVVKTSFGMETTISADLMRLPYMKDDVKAYITEEAFEVIKSKELFVKMAEDVLMVASWGAKYELTYELLPESTVMFIINGDGDVMGSISGSAKNAYGVPGKLDTWVTFDQDGEIKRNDKGNLMIRCF